MAVGLKIHYIVNFIGTIGLETITWGFLISLKRVVNAGFDLR